MKIIKKYLNVSLITFTLLSNAWSADLNRSPSGIFGTDSRKWVPLKSDTLTAKQKRIAQLSESVAVNVPRSRIKDFDNLTQTIVTIYGQSYKDEWNTCSEVRFNEESSIPVCTAFLVGKKTLLTAGHCGVINDAGCKNNAWVFDYLKNSPAIQSFKTNDLYSPFNESIPSNLFYRCNKILAKAYDEKIGLDFSLIELDREVTDRSPVKFYDWSKGAPKSIFTIGGLAGTRLVSVDPAKVVNVTDSHIEAPYTSFAKGSGGPVFDEKTGTVVGMVVKSSMDFFAEELLYQENDPSTKPVAPCKKEFILKGPWKKTTKNIFGQEVNVPYSEAERIDWIDSQKSILSLIK